MDSSDVISPLLIFSFIVIAFALWRYFANRVNRRKRTLKDFEPLRAEAAKLGNEAKDKAEADKKDELDALLRASRRKEDSQ